MASNKFSTILHRNSPRIAAILVYTVLEWTLIALLLLNALFSYLTAKFASYFGLPSPCVLCSRLDHLFEPGTSYRDHLCIAHAAEISSLGYCGKHRRLAAASEMCDDCVPERAATEEQDLRCSCCGVVVENGLHSPYLLMKPPWEIDGNSELEGEYGDWVAAPVVCGDTVLEAEGEMGAVESKEEQQGMDFDECFDTLHDGNDYRRLVPLELIDSATLMENPRDDGRAAHGMLERDLTELIVASDPIIDIVGNGGTQILKVDDVAEHHLKEAVVDFSTDKEVIHAVLEDNAGIEVEAGVVGGDPGVSLVSAEFGDSNTLIEKSVLHQVERDLTEQIVASVRINAVMDNRDVDGELRHGSLRREPTEQTVASVPVIKIMHSGDDFGDLGHGSCQRDHTEHTVASVPIIETMDCGTKILGTFCIVKENSSVLNAEEFVQDNTTGNLIVVPEEVHAVSEDNADVAVEVSATHGYFGEVQGIASEEEGNVMDTETNCEISIGSEICDQESIDPPHLHEHTSETSSLEFQTSGDYNEGALGQVIEIEPMETIVRDQDQTSVSPDLDEIGEERMPETPSSIDGMHALHKRFFFERREFGMESLDGSVASESEGSEAVTVDQLKAALKAKRDALRSLYVELEEERSASAIAASHTMAMITRLQEEKAAMQMEALQYQRMMEELSEYDQEALELMNEVMRKREKEKQDLEKELEMYRNKVLLYESCETRKIVSSRANGRIAISSASSTAEDSDDTSFDCNGSYEFCNTLDKSNQNIQTDGALSCEELPDADKSLMTLDDSFADFEEERLSILERFKALEEKLFMLDDDDDDSSSDPETTPDHFMVENGHALNGDYEGEIGFMNGFSHNLHGTGKLFVERRNSSCRGKKLLPLFDAICIQKEGVLCTMPEETDAASEPVSKSVRKKLAIAEEVDNVYERLQVLEADREFLKHCISSVKKGDKGIDLLQEILQHLRDLRNIELRARNAGGSHTSLSD